MTTRLDAMWHAIDATSDDNEAIAIVELEHHTGLGADERKGGNDHGTQTH